MLKKDNLLFGLGLALLASAFVFGLMYLLNHGLFPMMFGRALLRDATVMTISLGINLFLLNYYTKRNAFKTARGIMLFVFFGAAYVIYTFYADEFGFGGRSDF